MEKTTHNSAQNFIAKFSVSCKLFLLFSFCACGENSVAKPQRVLRAGTLAAIGSRNCKKNIRKK